jgi:predicted TIM-barrel fold metal-dependent hydrolase
MIIDSDSHLREANFIHEIYRLEGHWAKYSPRKVGEGEFENVPDPRTPKVRLVQEHSIVGQHNKSYVERQSGGWDMERRVHDIDVEGIDIQMIFPTRIEMATTLPGGLGAAMCHAYNNWVANLVKGHEDRLFPVALMPGGCPDEMANELRRCINDLGFHAAHLVCYTDSRNLDDPAQELKVPLFCHPNTPGELINRSDNFYAMHVLGRPTNCQAALIPLVIGGVFERFPELKVAFFECYAEWPLYWMHRMDDDAERLQPIYAPYLSTLPSEYVKRNCYFTCEVDEPHLGFTLQELGDHVLLATDYPHHDSEWPNCVRSIRERSDISEEQKQSILGDAARTMLNL